MAQLRLRRIFQNQNFYIQVVKYFSAFFVFSENFLAARALSVSDYGQLSTALQMATVFSMVGVGGGQAFLIHYFNSEVIHYRAYAICYLAQYIGGLALLWSVQVLFFEVPPYYLSVFLAIPLGVNLILEPLLRVHRHFVLALSFRSWLAFIPVFFYSYSIYFTKEPSLVAALDTTMFSWGIGAFLFGVVSVLILKKRSRVNVFHVTFVNIKDHFIFYGGIFKQSLVPSLATALFVINLSIDRLFLDKFYLGTDLGVYSLAFQLCTGASLFLSTQTYLLGVRLGEIHKSKTSSGGLARELNAQLRTLSLQALSILVLLCFGTYFLTLLVPKYGHLGPVVFVLGIGMFAPLVGGHGNYILQLRGDQKGVLLSYFYLIFAGVLLRFGVVLLKGPWINIVVSGSVLLVFHSLYLWFYVKRRL